jgi:FKBP-type peptidyl-prolyl cis-trans isomerase
MKKIFILGLFLLFLAACDDVEKLESGLQFADDTTGTGEEAMLGDLVSLHFTGWIIMDSTDLFNDWKDDSVNAKGYIGSSRDMNKPVKFLLGSGNFIKGVDEGIEGMKAGGTRTIIIPSYLAYGEQGYGPIPPNSSLKIVVQLLDTKKMEQVKQWEADTSKAITTKSGLKYVVINEGKGDDADSGDVVFVHYTGWLKDGTKFDSSVERDDPITITLGRGMVIPGLEEGIDLLKEGSKVKLIIPPSLAYGERAMGKIPSNSTLIFDIEVVDVK